MSTPSAFASGEGVHLRLFLEGIEVPVVSATVQAAEGAPASASIDIVPLDAGLALPPRTLVHLFYWDDGEMAYGSGATEDAYKLLFSGELMEVAESRDGAGSRSMTLICTDFTSYLDAAKLHEVRYANNANAIAGNTEAFLNGTDFGAVTDIPSTEIEMLIASLASGAEGDPWTTSFSGTQSALAGLLSVLEVVGGVPDISSGLNGWFTYNERRVRLMDQIGTDKGDTAAKIFDATVFTNFLKGKLGQYGDALSFRDILNLILSYVFYGISPNPVASYKKGHSNPQTQRPVEKKKKGVSFTPRYLVYLPATGAVTDYLSGLTESQMYYAKFIEANFLAKGAEREVIAGAIVNAYAESRLNPVVQSTAGHPPAWPRTAEMDNGTDTTGASYRGHENSFGLFQLFSKGAGQGMTIAERQDPEKNCNAIWVDKGVPQVRSLWSGGERNVAVMAAQWSYLVERPGDALGAMTVRSDMAARLFRDKAFVFLNTGSKEANDALLAEAEAASQGTTVISASIPVDTSAATRSKLITTIIRPDIWYAAPPVCNVVFPEEYRAFSFRRPLLECTRLQLSTYDALIASGYEYEIQQRAYFAPVFGEGTGIDSLKEGGIGMASSPLVYPHEVYSGIVPKLERMSDIAFLAAMSAAVSEEEQTQYAEIAAAFNFLRNRYAGRTVSVSGRFLPRLVCGLPGAVVSRVPDSPLPELSPTHYVGMITSVTHSVSADAGATTSFTMAYARPHIPDESDQFVKSMRVLKSRKEASHTVSPLTGMSSLDESLASWLDGVLAAGDRVELTEAECASAPPGPNGKKIIRVVGIQVGATGTNTNETTSSETSPEQATSSPADPTSVHKFQSATFVEEFSGKDLPIEDAIRPPWISEDYNNTRIGPIFYKSLIGCASLTDLVSLQDAQEIDPKATAVSVELALTRVVGDYAMLSDGGAKVCSGWIWQQTKRAHGTIDDVLYGFHKNAYGDLSGLEGLGLDKPLSPKMAVSLDGDLAAGTVSATLDVRARRAEAVRRYANRLFGVRGLRG